ncbi:thymidylate kinase [Haloactinospora alba]|uniref:Thymidylate kinase n=1 Tax=Haloactinospora alba TaxID=405555 RepID=A0A543NNZ6_9ACTN|nr:dTMP kinase [Haloactinospora alba]TQN33542.1 thymidylate kinase [Haloactinospora alba]
MSRGLFVAIDGPGAAGKSTLLRNLTSRLTGTGVPVLSTTEPSRGEIGQLARSRTREHTGMALACLVGADRYHHLETEIRPAVGAGKVVLCDRYTLSSLVLQAGIDGVPESVVRCINAHADPPDLQIVLTAPPDVLRERLAVRGSHGRFEDDPTLPGREVELYRGAAAVSERAGVRTIAADTSQGPEAIESLLSGLTSTIGGLWSRRHHESA